MEEHPPFVHAMKHWATILCLLLTLSLGLAQENGGFQYGPRPPAPIFDPTSFLTPDQTAKIVAPLEAINTRDGVDILVVILPDIGDAPPEHVAGGFATAWCSQELNAIILYSPGRKDSPWIIPGGRTLDLIKRPIIDKAISEAQRRAAREPFESGKIRAASIEAADLLRLWKGSAVTQGEEIKSWRETLLAQRRDQLRGWKLIVLVAACTFTPFILVLWLVIRHLRQRGPRHFPQPVYAQRLGAPFCGGNSAAIDLESISGKS